MSTNIQTPDIKLHSIIACVNDLGETKFLSEDRYCGEYYWSDYLSLAQMFSYSENDIEIMNRLLKIIQENKLSPTMGGTVEPSRLVYSGAGLNNDKSKGSIRVFKMDVTFNFNISSSFTVDAEITKPTGRT